MLYRGLAQTLSVAIVIVKNALLSSTCRAGACGSGRLGLSNDEAREDERGGNGEAHVGDRGKDFWYSVHSMRGLKV